MELTSPAFKEGSDIPAKYTCDKLNVSPQLEWTNLPAGTKSLALICDDPDASSGSWVHWVVFNIPVTLPGLPENVTRSEKIIGGSIHGKSDFGRLGYGGPCPPGGTHRYFFNLYALDSELVSQPGITKKELVKEMEGHILAEAQLMGRYKRV